MTDFQLMAPSNDRLQNWLIHETPKLIGEYDNLFNIGSTLIQELGSDVMDMVRDGRSEDRSTVMVRNVHLYEKLIGCVERMHKLGGGIAAGSVAAFDASLDWQRKSRDVTPQRRFGSGASEVVEVEQQVV